MADEVKALQKQQKRSKRKARRKTKANELTGECPHVQDTSIPEKSEDLVTRRRTSSFCSCLCHYCDQRSNSLSIIHTTMPSPLLVKSQSCPSLLLFNIDTSPKAEAPQMTDEQTLRLSSSSETLFSSISTRECVCHDRPLTLSTSVTFASSSMSCIRCSSTRTDPGYSSGKDS